MSEEPDEQVRTRCGCLPRRRAMGKSKGSNLTAEGGGAAGAKSGGNRGSRGSRGSPNSGVGGAAASLRDISLEEAPANGGENDRYYSHVYSGPAPPRPPPVIGSATASPGGSTGGMGTPRYKPGGGVAAAASPSSGLAASGAAAVPAEWRQSYEKVRRAVVAEAVRATVEWSLKRRWDVPCAPEQAAEVRTAVERRVSDNDMGLKPAAVASARDTARWVAAVRTVKDTLPTTPQVGALATECEAVLLAAMQEVVDPNLKALSEHLHKIADEQLQQAAQALRADPPPPGAALDAAVHAKATAVHHVMAVALDDVQQQFVGGVADVCAQQLEARLGDATAAATLISGSVEVRRRAIEAPWRLSALILELQNAANPPPPGVGAMKAVARGATSLIAAVMMGGSIGSDGAPMGSGSSAAGGTGSYGDGQVSSLYKPPSLLSSRPGAQAARLLTLLESDPHAWLRELILALDDPTEALPINPLGMGPFVLTSIAHYLDPHVDGERQPLSPAQLRNLLKDGSFLDRLKVAWDSGAGALAAAAASQTSVKASLPTPRGAAGSAAAAAAATAAAAAAASVGAAAAGAVKAVPFECRRELVIGCYIRHAVHKMNMTLAFGQHVPGVGRQSISAMAQQRHTKILAVSVLEAVQRDFNNGNAVKLGELTLTTDLLENIVTEHLSSIFSAHADLNAALAIANKEGEEARKGERMRIWGYA